jgi:hypothetical protein
MRAGQPLISHADETKREFLLTREEEQQMLDACGKRKHLCPILIFFC